MKLVQDEENSFFFFHKFSFLKIRELMKRTNKQNSTYFIKITVSSIDINLE